TERLTALAGPCQCMGPLAHPRVSACDETEFLQRVRYPHRPPPSTHHRLGQRRQLHTPVVADSANSGLARWRDGPGIQRMQEILVDTNLRPSQGIADQIIQDAIIGAWRTAVRRLAALRGTTLLRSGTQLFAHCRFLEILTQIKNTG